MASRRQPDRREGPRNAGLLDRLLRDHRNALLRQARFHSERAQDAEDPLGDACVQFLLRFDGGDTEQARRWMLVVVRRCAWAIPRRRRERHAVVEEVSTESLMDDLGFGVVDGRRGPAESLMPRSAGDAGGATARSTARSPSGGHGCAGSAGEGVEIVTPTPSSLMSPVRTIGFADALGRLQELLGRDVHVLVNFRGTFGGVAMQGRISRVETVPPEEQAVNILLDDRQGLMLDPIDTEVLLVEDSRTDDWWLEFHLPSGVAILLEPIRAHGRSFFAS